MVGGPWLRVLEAYAVQALLRSPTFHRGVEKVAKNVHRIRNGLPPEETGGTSVDDPSRSGFGKHFLDEMKTQLGRAEQRNTDAPMRTKGVHDDSVDARAATEEEQQDADAVWRSTRLKAGEKEEEEKKIKKKKKKKREGVEEKEETSDAAWLNTQRRVEKKQTGGFLSDYMDAIREQIGNNKPPR